MAAAVVILLVMVAVGVLLNPSREQFAWFLRLRRPAWLTFEGLMAGWLWGVALAVLVQPHSAVAVLLLIPFLLWSPVGTLVTWQMQRLNR